MAYETLMATDIAGSGTRRVLNDLQQMCFHSRRSISPYQSSFSLDMSHPSVFIILLQPYFQLVFCDAPTTKRRNDILLLPVHGRRSKRAASLPAGMEHGTFISKV